MPKPSGIFSVILGIIILPFNNQITAHHSRANFDLDKTIQIEGTVTRWQYRNPHAYLQLNIKNNTEEKWTIELGSIPNLKQMGMERDSIKVGDKVSVVGNPDRNSQNPYLFFDSMVHENGSRYAFKDVFLYSGKAKEAGKNQPGSVDFIGKWDEERSRLATLIGLGLPDYSVTEKGKKLISNYKPSEEPSFFCQPVGLPSMIGTPYAIEITKTPDSYEIYFELPGTKRIIHMNMKEHPENTKPSVYGHSIGRLEEGVLIVDSAKFIPTKWGIGDGLDSSEQKHVVEEYRLKEEGHILEITYTVTDPVYLSSPFSRTHIKRIVPDYVITDYEECDLEIAKMHLELES